MRNRYGEEGFREGWSLFESMIRKALKTTPEKRHVLFVRPYIRSLAENSLKQLQSSRLSGLSKEVFETHRSVIVRLLLPEHVHPRSVRIEGDSSRITISGINGKKQEVIYLPASVSRKKPKRTYRNGILEISMPKKAGSKSGSRR